MFYYLKKINTTIIWLSCFGAALLPASLGFAASPKIALLPALRSELNSVLKSVDGLHSACVTQNQKLIEEAIDEVIKSLGKAEKSSPLAQVQQTHLVKILSAAKKKLEASQGQEGPMRKDLLKEAFKDLVQISRVYQLDSYNVFFCNHDNTLWLQKSPRPQNPINPQKFGSCGRPVR